MHGWRRWRSNGGDLEAQRELAMTIFTDEVQLLLVAPSIPIKEKVRTDLARECQTTQLLTTSVVAGGDSYCFLLLHDVQ